MRMKKEPTIPERKPKTISENIDYYADQALTESIKEFEQDCVRHGVDMSHFDKDKIMITSSGEWDDFRSCFTIELPESDKSFDKRMASYYQRKAEYDKWYEDNKQTIVAALEKKKQATKKALETKKENLIKKKKKIEKELEKLK